jgi:hypothetical protein
MRCADTLAPPPTAGASAATGADDRVSSERARFDAALARSSSSPSGSELDVVETLASLERAVIACGARPAIAR